MSITKRGDRYVAKYKHLTAIASNRQVAIAKLCAAITNSSIRSTK